MIVYILTLGFFLYLIVRIISPFLLIRWKQLRSNTIGHYTINTELYLCERDLKINDPKKKFIDFFYLIPGHETCNSQLTKMWKRQIKILPWQILKGLDILNKIIPGGAKHNIVTSSSYSNDVKNLLDITKIHLEFSKEEESIGVKFLKNLGLSKNDKFVCLIVRDSAYHNNLYYTDNPYSYHSYRDCKIENFIKACDFLTSKGFYVFRMGKSVNSKFEINNDMVIDYATNGMRSDFLDIYLGSKCSFWISTNTGIDGLSQIFRIPAVFVNQVPIAFARTTHTNSVLTFKHHLDNNKKKYLSVKEIINQNLEYALKSEDYTKKNISIIENNQDEVCDAVKELYEIVFKNKDLINESKNLQKKFWEIFPYNKKLHGNIKTLVSPSFLKNNPYLLE